MATTTAQTGYSHITKDPCLRFVHIGVFIKVVPPCELVYSWRWIEGPLHPAETLVELHFERSGAGAVVRLCHSQFVDDAERDRHVGWEQSFERLLAWLPPSPRLHSPGLRRAGPLH